MRARSLLGVLALAGSIAYGACSGDSANIGSGVGGTGGTGTSSSGTGDMTSTGSAGTSGSSGNGGAATSTGMGAGGSSGTAGTGGSVGSSGGSAGSGGSGQGGAGGTAGTGGASGAAGADGGIGGSGGGATDAGRPADGSASPMMNFFVSSDTSATANLGGLTGADQRCQRLAAAVGLGNKTWHAYLSAASPMTNARDRIGEGPYYNANGTMLAATKDALHARNGDPALFITEQGKRINGQWAGSPTPIEHDILTGSNVNGMLAMNLTCGDWMATTGTSQVGHTDGLGPGMNAMEPYNHWNSVHTGQCANTAPGGGAGRIYCFVAP
jgi:hypothetical protein